MKRTAWLPSWARCSAVFRLLCGDNPGFAEEAQPQPDANLQFQWAFGALKKANGSKFEAIARDTILKTGDHNPNLIEGR